MVGVVAFGGRRGSRVGVGRVVVGKVGFGRVVGVGRGIGFEGDMVVGGGIGFRFVEGNFGSVVGCARWVVVRVHLRSHRLVEEGNLGDRIWTFWCLEFKLSRRFLEAFVSLRSRGSLKLLT